MRHSRTCWMGLILSSVFLTACKSAPEAVRTRSIAALERLNKTNNAGFTGEGYSRMHELLDDPLIDKGYKFKPDHYRLNAFKNRQIVGLTIRCFWFDRSAKADQRIWHLRLGDNTYEGSENLVEMDTVTKESVQGGFEFVDISFTLKRNDIQGGFPPMIIWNSENEGRKWKLSPDEKQLLLSRALMNPEALKEDYLTIQNWFAGKNVSPP